MQPTETQPSKPITSVLNFAREVTPEVNAEIDRLFDYQPWSRHQERQGVAIRTVLAEAVKVIVTNVPPCPDRTTAIRKIREARMDCNAAITFDGRY